MEDEREPDEEAVADPSTDGGGVGSGSFLGSMISGTTIPVPGLLLSLLALDVARFFAFFVYVPPAFVISLTGSFPRFRRSFDL